MKTYLPGPLNQVFSRCTAIVAAALVAAGLPARALTINSSFASSITSDPNAAAIESTINTAVQFYDTSFADAISVNITFQEGGGLGSSNTEYFTGVSYLNYLTALANHATSANDTTALDSLDPFGADNPVNGNTTLDITTALAKALGLGTFTGTDSVITLNTTIMNLNRTTIDPAKYDLQSVVEHEIDEVLGTSSGLGSGLGSILPADLFRYTAEGARTYTTTGDDAYFSIDGGVTDLARYNEQAGGDYGDWYSYYGNVTALVQNAYGTPGVIPIFGPELTMLDVIGYDYVPVPEPGASALILAGLVVSGAIWRRRIAGEGQAPG